MFSRGGVKDTRLEAKDTKKFRGQCQEQTLLRPRTKDTGPSVLKKNKKGLQIFVSREKGLQIFFSANLYLRKPKKRSLQIFREVSGVFNKISTVQK